MAAEASRSTSTTTGSPDSYLGSVISLTSKSEIRYEGILFNINTQEASIGLRNVRSFGTEGRRTDGQVPASDKVYEYIVFRGSDIKDLQVKSSPPVQTAPPPVHNDPAIIQSQYAAPSASSNLPTASVPATGSLSDLNNQMPQPGPPPLTSYQNTMPMYQPGGNIPKWNPSTPPAPNVSGLSMPMYWQGYYGPSGPNQAQQPLLRPVQGLSEPPSMQPPLTQQLGQGQHSSMNPSLPTGASNVSVSQSMDFPSPLLQPDVLDKSTVANLVPNQTKPISGTMPFNGLSDSVSDAGKMSTSPALVTPGQFLKPGPTISPTGQTEHKDVEVVEVPPPPPQASMISVTTQASVPASVEAQAPLLPLPSPSNARMDGFPSQTRYVNRGGRDRRRGNEFSHPVVNFTEEFDFEAMNEKFKKDEVWGHLGKSKAKADDELDFQDEDDVNLPKVDKPVYKKDDFFDTLSSNALDRESYSGRTRFSEQMKLDTETFGNFQRNRGYRGGRGPGGGRSRGGGYYGRGNGYGYGYGYGYGGRGGRGNSVYRAF